MSEAISRGVLRMFSGLTELTVVEDERGETSMTAAASSAHVSSLVRRISRESGKRLCFTSEKMKG